MTMRHDFIDMFVQVQIFINIYSNIFYIVREPDALILEKDTIYENFIV